MFVKHVEIDFVAKIKYANARYMFDGNSSPVQAQPRVFSSASSKGSATLVALTSSSFYSSKLSLVCILAYFDIVSTTPFILQRPATTYIYELNTHPSRR
eukprot:1175345-Prorocentrum_minimum.AAC.2